MRAHLYVLICKIMESKTQSKKDSGCLVYRRSQIEFGCIFIHFVTFNSNAFNLGGVWALVNTSIHEQGGVEAFEEEHACWSV